MPRYRKWGRVMAAIQAKHLNRFLLSQIERSENPPSLIFASGSLVYGNSNLPHSEDAPLSPISYSRQYHHGENPVLQAIHEDKMRVMMLRFPWLLGKGSWFQWFYIKSLQEKNQVPLFGDGSNLMSLISLHDAARMMVRYGMSDLGSGIYNVFSPVTVTQKSFAGMVAGNYAGTVTDYLNLYPKGVEKSVYEAFTSNILLDSNHPEILKGYPFQRLDEILQEIIK
jgi:nucleoside-diphosphate-sugar epimerase